MTVQRLRPTSRTNIKPPQAVGPTSRARWKSPFWPIKVVGIAISKPTNYKHHNYGEHLQSLANNIQSLFYWHLGIEQNYIAPYIYIYMVLLICNYEKLDRVLNSLIDIKSGWFSFYHKYEVNILSSYHETTYMCIILHVYGGKQHKT